MGTPKLAIIQNPQYCVVQLPDLALKTFAESLDEDSKLWLESSQTTHVFDFANVLQIEAQNLKSLLQFNLSAKKTGKRIFSVNLKSNVQKVLMEKGVLLSFNPCKSLEEVDRKINQKPSIKVDAKVLRPFIEGATTAFEVQVKIPLKTGKVSSKNYLYEDSDVVVGQVDVETDGFHGKIAACFSEPVFKAIYFSLLGEKIESISEESADAAGELINIIYGYAKTALNLSLGLKLKPALPTVLLRPGKQSLDYTVLVVPFETDAGSFRLEIVVL